MSEAVKRFVVDIQGREARECVFAADHDRIVAELQERVDRLSEDSIKDNANFGRAFKGLEAERDTLRAEVERLKEHEPRFEDVGRLVKTLSFLGVSTPESMEESCIRWPSLVRTLIRTAEDSKMLRQDSERLAEVERLHARVAAAAECLAGWHRHEAVPRTAVDAALKILDARESSGAESEIRQLRKDAALFRRLRDLPDELLGAPGVPCVAVPDGPKAGRYVSGPDLDAALEAAR